jgi:hypothetical protein
MDQLLAAQEENRFDMSGTEWAKKLRSLGRQTLIDGFGCACSGLRSLIAQLERSLPLTDCARYPEGAGTHRSC